MKKVIITLFSLGAIGGGGLNAPMFLIKPANASEAQAKEVAGDEKKGEGKEGEVAGPSFVELEPLVLPVMDEDGVSQVVSLVVALEVKDELSVQMVKNLAPRLKDVYIQDMYGAISRQAVIEGGMLQVGPIKARLAKVSAKVLGKDTVKEVLLQVVQQRPI